MCLGFRDGSAVIHHGKGNDAGATPNVLAPAEPGAGSRLITSIAGRDTGQGAAFPRFTSPSPETGWQ